MVIEIAGQAVPRERTSRSATLLGLLIVGCLACDFFAMQVVELVPWNPGIYFPLMLACAGCVMAQGCLLAAWLAWSDQPLCQRLLRHWTVAAFLYLVWLAGLAWGFPDRLAMVGKMVGLSVPLISIAAQLPLWFARQVFGWRLIRGDTNKDIRGIPISIRDLMLATVIVALALAPAQWVRSPDGKEMETPWLVMLLAATAISAIAMLPTSPLLLRTRHFERGALLACLYAAFWMALPWVVVLIARNRGLFASPPWPVLLGLSCLVLSFATTAILAAAAARAHGYRLISVNRATAKPTTLPET
jgi:hypothetical protein